MLLKLIGYGASATVYLARGLIKKHDTVAIKVLRQEYSQESRMLKRFKQEGAIIDQLDHPHIVKIMERGRHEENLYIVMEYLQGQTLAEKIKKDKQVPISQFIDILTQIAEVLCVLHDKKIIHRDLKPSNIMLIKRESNENFVKLLDFGLARAFYHTQITESGSLLGTIHYIPPEQITHSRFSPAGDIYALGMIAYEMISGILPFKGIPEFEILQIKISQDLPEPLKDSQGDLSKINQLVKRMIARESDLRPTATEILGELKSIDI